jgi:hypothetical protein
MTTQTKVRAEARGNAEANRVTYLRRGAEQRWRDTQGEREGGGGGERV